jgi:hypothetical protein
MIKKCQYMGAYWIAFLTALLLAVGGSAPSRADSHAGVALAEAIVVRADVVGIDRADRTVTLVGPRGNVVSVEAGEDVRNFDQIKVGDQLKVTYYESVALYLGVPGSQPEVDAAAVVGRAAKGEKPAGMAVGAIDLSAVVKGIDKKQREVTLKMPNGNVVTHKVDPAVKAFGTLKVGDTVHARVTRALAIAVESP